MVVSRRQSSGRLRVIIERRDRRIQRTAVAHRTASVAEIRTAVGATVTQRTVRNPSLQGQLQTSRCCLGANDSRMLVRKAQGEHLKQNYLWSRYTRPTPGVMVWEAISYATRSSFVVIPNTLTANLSGNSTYRTVIHEQHSRSFPTG
ncbi:transposable element Tc1 transposase [Trichonephila clavipes]|nr:transposable element Tc1 transposase [Trichonephila clavipes]